MSSDYVDSLIYAHVATTSAAGKLDACKSLTNVVSHKRVYIWCVVLSYYAIIVSYAHKHNRAPLGASDYKSFSRTIYKPELHLGRKACYMHAIFSVATATICIQGGRWTLPHSPQRPYEYVTVMGASLRIDARNL